MSDSQPQVIVLGGSTGLGKTTSSHTILADTLGVRTFLNADTIAR
jgi:2-phosphoglycerate kinase